jgi:ZIP family zinc transporter
VGGALLFGAVASSALLIGAGIGPRVRLRERLLASLLAFASGALITALAFELFEDSYEQGGLWRGGLGMVVGAVVFTALSALLDRWAKPDGSGADDDTEEGSPELDKDAATAERRPTAASAQGTAGRPGVVRMYRVAPSDTG